MATTTPVPGIPLRGDVTIPQLGLGVWQVPPDVAADNVRTALEIGYRHVDTAAAYGTEAQVGEGIRASGLDRDEVFVTTKVFNDQHGHEEATRALDASLERLGMDHVDLYLIHWPVPAHDRYVETWQALVDAQRAGRTRAIGVSNFEPHHLERIIEATGVTPAVNQIELHPYLQQHELRRFHDEHGIVTEAWSPLAQSKAVDDETIAAIGEAHGKTAGQVTLRWHLQRGFVVFPKSVTPERVRQNFEVFDFELTPDELATIDGLDRGERIGPHPDEFVMP